MPSLPLKTSRWPADPAEPILDTTVSGMLRAAAERTPDLVPLTAGEAEPALAALSAASARIRRSWRPLLGLCG